MRACARSAMCANRIIPMSLQDPWGFLLLSLSNHQIIAVYCASMSLVPSSVLLTFNLTLSKAWSTSCAVTLTILEVSKTSSPLWYLANTLNLNVLPLTNEQFSPTHRTASSPLCLISTAVGLIRSLYLPTFIVPSSSPRISLRQVLPQEVRT